jgi:hypothetical protein
MGRKGDVFLESVVTGPASGACITRIYGLAVPGPPESFGMEKMRETAPRNAVGCIIDTGPGRQTIRDIPTIWEKELKYMALVRVFNAGEPELGPSVARANFGDSVEWPHLESCLGMLLVLDDHSMVAGHVVMFEGSDPPELDTPDNNAAEYLYKMVGLVDPDRTIIYFGAFVDGGWEFHVRTLQAALRQGIFCEAVDDLNCDQGGVDLRLNSSTWTLTAPGHFARHGIYNFRGHPQASSRVLQVP